MPTFSQLPSGKWRVQVRRAGLYRAKTLATKTEANKWGTLVEAGILSGRRDGVLPVPKDATLAHLIEKYTETDGKLAGRTKTAALAMLRRTLGHIKLAKIEPAHLRDFIDKRVADGAGGVTIAGDLSFLSGVLSWGREARLLDLPDDLPRKMRRRLKHRKLDTRGKERDREPSDEELTRLYVLWDANSRQRIDMPLLCRFALATGMRLGEICGLDVEA